MAKKPKKSKEAAPPRPKFNMAEPNDDMAAFGWNLGKLRYPAASSQKDDIWPGRSMFDVENASEIRREYGFEVQFVCARYVQMLLDQEEETMIAAQKVHDAGYTQAAREEFRAKIQQLFQRIVVPDMITNFNKVSQAVADFYAARLAHIAKFGTDTDDD
jgi:hypothetical protein